MKKYLLFIFIGITTWSIALPSAKSVTQTAKSVTQKEFVSTKKRSVFFIQNNKKGTISFYIGNGLFVTTFQFLYNISATFENNTFIHTLSVFHPRLNIQKIMHIDLLNDLVVMQIDPKMIPFLDQLAQPLKIAKNTTSLTKNLNYELMTLIFSPNKNPQQKNIPIIPYQINSQEQSLVFGKSSSELLLNGSPLLVDNKIVGIMHELYHSMELIEFAEFSSHLSTLLKQKPLNCINGSCIKTQLQVLKNTIQNKEPQTQYKLAMLYYTLYNTKSAFQSENTLELSILLFQQAAQQEHKNAQYVLGNIHANKTLSVYNNKTSISLIQQAAQQGQLSAQYMMGLILFYGDGIESNKNRAIYWFQQAAQQGHIQSKIFLLEHTSNCFSAFKN